MRYPRIFPRSASGTERGASLAGLLALLLGLASCSTVGGWMPMGLTGDGGRVTQSDRMDLKLMQAETSPIPGAQARVFPPPADAGVLPNPTQAGFCVTAAGYCPLAAMAPTGENCLCAASPNMYGGKTGAAPERMTLNRMFQGTVPGATPP